MHIDEIETPGAPIGSEILGQPPPNGGVLQRALAFPGCVLGNGGGCALHAERKCSAESPLVL